MQRKALVRHAFIGTVLAANSLVCQAVLGSGYLDVVSTVRVGAWVILFGGVYAAGNRVLLRKPLLQGLPQLSLGNVFGYVYGLGLIVFVLVYCLLGANLFSQFMLYTGLASLCIDDLVAAHGQPFAMRCFAGVTVLLAFLSALTLILDGGDTLDVIQAVDQGNWAVVLGGLVGPIATPFLFHGVRGPKSTLITTTLETLHFALPFALILAVLELSALSSCGGATNTYTMVVPLPVNLSTIPPLGGVVGNSTGDIFVESMRQNMWIPLLPATIFPCVFFAIHSIVSYETIDFLLAAVCVSVTRHFLHDAHKLASQAGLPLLFVAIVCKLASDHHSHTLERTLENDDDDSSVQFNSEEVDMETIRT